MKEPQMLIVSNQIKCNNCNVSIFSAHRYDYITCKCGRVSVDGGQNYLKRSGTDYEELSIFIEEKALEVIVEEAKISRLGGRNDLGVVLAVLRSIRDNSIKQQGLNWVIKE